MGTVLVAGATGHLGRHVCWQLQEQGEHVRALTRSPDRVTVLSAVPDEIHVADACTVDLNDLIRACDRADVVFSCLGASVQPSYQRPDRSFHQVDLAANLRLLEAARYARAKKFVYVSVFGGDRLRHLAYVRAHEEVVDAIKASGIDYCVIRPVGFFSAFEMVLERAASGRSVPVIGDGSARSNPIADADLAKVCVEAFSGDERDVPVGGPEVLTREKMVTLAFQAVGRKTNIKRVPSWSVRTASFLARPVSARIAALGTFYAEVSKADLVAPTHGDLTLYQYYRQLTANRTSLE